MTCIILFHKAYTFKHVFTALCIWLLLSIISLLLLLLFTSGFISSLLLLLHRIGTVIIILDPRCHWLLLLSGTLSLVGGAGLLSFTPQPTKNIADSKDPPSSARSRFFITSNLPSFVVSR